MSEPSGESQGRDDFDRGWLETEVGRQVRPVVRRRPRRPLLRRLRGWWRAFAGAPPPD